MFKSLIVFCRKRYVKKYGGRKINFSLPDVNNISSMIFLIDPEQTKNVKDIETVIKQLFAPKQYRILIVCDALPDDQMQTVARYYITKSDFNIFGTLKKEKKEEIESFEEGILINMVEDNDLIFNDYILSVVRSSFRIGHSKLNMNLHDIVLDYGTENRVVERLKILHKYLLMLSGKNEK